MNFNINENLYFIYKNIKNIILIYFTNEPYFMLIQASNNESLTYYQISLELINAKKKFWISNALMFIIIIFRNNQYFYYINKILYLISCFLYTLSLSTVVNIIQYFDD